MDRRVFLFFGLLLIPIVVAGLKLDLLTTIIVVLFWLLLTWLERLVSLQSRTPSEGLVLETIAISHYVEKVRWCLDKLGVSYTERRHAGTLGAFFLGRTVPRLQFKTGAVISSIGNSPEILRYLWGRYGVELGERARFLQPTECSLRWERSFDRYGADLQRWVYGHILPSPRFTLRAWGFYDHRVPIYQRLLLVCLYPLLRLLMVLAFRITAKNRIKSKQRIEALIQDVESHLATGTAYLCGDQLSYADIGLAALSGIWIFPKEYGNGTCSEVIPNQELVPHQMRLDIEAWRSAYPKTVSFIECLYQEERQT